VRASHRPGAAHVFAGWIVQLSSMQVPCSRGVPVIEMGRVNSLMGRTSATHYDLGMARSKVHAFYASARTNCLIRWTLFSSMLVRGLAWMASTCSVIGEDLHGGSIAPPWSTGLLSQECLEGNSSTSHILLPQASFALSEIVG
jgi:hypothetical protein